MVTQISVQICPTGNIIIRDWVNSKPPEPPRVRVYSECKQRKYRATFKSSRIIFSTLSIYILMLRSLWNIMYSILFCLVGMLKPLMCYFGGTVLSILCPFILCILVAAACAQHIGSFLESSLQHLPGIKWIFTKFILFPSLFASKDSLGAVTSSALSEVQRATTVADMMRYLDNNAVRLSETAVLLHLSYN